MKPIFVGFVVLLKLSRIEEPRGGWIRTYMHQRNSTEFPDGLVTKPHSICNRGSQCFADADADPFLFSNFAKIEKGRSKFR